MGLLLLVYLFFVFRNCNSVRKYSKLENTYGFESVRDWGQATYFEPLMPIWSKGRLSPDEEVARTRIVYRI